MVVIIERDVFLHAEKSNEMLKKAVQIFEEYLGKKRPLKSPEYYQARSYLKQGQDYLEETLKRCKQILGPLSPYSAQALLENKITVRGLNRDELRTELTQDEFLQKILGREEILAYLNDNFVSQMTGQRKLANMKVRMIIDKLRTLSLKGQELQAAAQKYFQAG